MVCSGSRSGLARDGSPPPARPSWIARASRPLTGGAARLRRRQEGQRPQAPPAGRHPRAGLQGPGNRGRRRGPRRRRPVAQEPGPPSVPPAASRLGRWRLPRSVPGLGSHASRYRLPGGVPQRWRATAALASARRDPPIVSPFTVVPRRWVVERTFAWLGRYRRLSKDYEYLTATSEQVIYLAMTRLLLRRLTRP